MAKTDTALVGSPGPIYDRFVEYACRYALREKLLRVAWELEETAIVY